MSCAITILYIYYATNQLSCCLPGPIPKLKTTTVATLCLLSMVSARFARAHMLSQAPRPVSPQVRLSDPSVVNGNPEGPSPAGNLFVFIFFATVFRHLFRYAIQAHRKHEHGLQLADLYTAHVVTWPSRLFHLSTGGASKWQTVDLNFRPHLPRKQTT